MHLDSRINAGQSKRFEKRFWRQIEHITNTTRGDQGSSSQKNQPRPTQQRTRKTKRKNPAGILWTCY